jgi:uncharacterized protein
MKRKIYEKLVEWKNVDQGRSAILLNGARRVGKSYIVEEFAKANYRTHLTIDFSKAKDDARVADTFRTYLSQPDEFFKRLSTIFNVRFHERETLFVFDEVQMFPRAREAIKTLVADGRYDYVETGSLVSIKNNVKGILIPSEELDIDMHPMDFEEFLWAKGNETLMGMIRECFEQRKPMGPAHRTAMDALREYMIVGGMPQAVLRYVETGDFKSVDREKRKILSLYRKGIKEHADSLSERVEALYDFIPSQLQEHEKRVVLADLEPNARMRDYQDPIFWLNDARVVNVAYNATEPNVGLRLSLDHSTLKCYFADTGLLISHAFDENELMREEIHSRLLFDDIALNEGMLTENLVAQMLVASGRRLYFFSRADANDRKNRMEIDFLVAKSKLARKNNIRPLEVKSGKRTTHRSLDKFLAKYSDWVDEPCLFWDRDLAVKDGILHLPLYMAPLI